MVYNNYGNRQSYQNNNYQESFKRIEVPLHEHYKDKEKLYLPDGVAHKKAKEFTGIASNQLRKILNQSKVCKNEASISDFKIARNHLLSLIPLAAYNAGRDKNSNILYSFLKEHLNEKSIQSKEDIDIFDDLFTSIVAFHKYEGGK